MDKTKIELVRSSWGQLGPQAGPAADHFYETLFRMDPEVRKLFRGDIAEQGAKLMKMIGVAVAKLDEPDVLVRALQDLADRHANYGVRAAHFQTVGSALISTLEKFLGAGFTPQVRDAWLAVYGTVTDVMVARMARSAGVAPKR